MSAFVVEDKTINRIVGKLYGCPSITGWLAGRLGDLGFDNTTEGHILLGRAMFQLNVDAVNQRYGEGQAEQFRPLDYRHRYEMASTHQAYKSLQCWLHQCSEGDVPERPLFKFFREWVKPALADEIIRPLPQYEAATWG